MQMWIKLPLETIFYLQWFIRTSLIQEQIKLVQQSLLRQKRWKPRESDWWDGTEEKSVGKLTCVGKHKLHLQKWEGFYLNLILIFSINLKWKEMLFNKKWKWISDSRKNHGLRNIPLWFKVKS